jgi:DNA polymerase elongation subunit (family B)
LRENPDVLAGYNTFGFDDGYIAERAKFRGLSLDFGRMASNQWRDRECVKTEKKTFELASGKFAVRYIDMPGRLAMDLFLTMRREHNLDSYKLDNVANTFLRGNVGSVRGREIFTKSTRGLFAGNLVRFDVVGNTLNPVEDGRKFEVLEVHADKFLLREPLHAEATNLEWSFAKDDVHPAEMFASHRGTPEQRAHVAKYCIQDCDLVLTLMAKLDTLVNARGMADVCRVPIQFTLLRGQGIKILSAVAYEASKRGQILQTQEGAEDVILYEGGIVLPPKIGMYLDQPIAVLDYNSLYPSNMIAYNLSPDTLVYVKNYSDSGRLLNPDVVKTFPNIQIDEVAYDIPGGKQLCGFAQPNANPLSVGILPLTLEVMLKKRKETRKKMEEAADDAQKAVLNGLQLAYKVVANSIYGQTGASTSPIRKVEVASCTTAVGRQKIYDAKRIVEEEFGAEVVYGDTDSIFVYFPTKSLTETIALGQQAAARITASGRKAHKIEYEKTFFPFILFCRKRYIGMKYELDPTKCKRVAMGVAIKRRDNAPVVKDILGGALDILLEDRDIRKAQRFVMEFLVRVMKNELPLDKFVITKQLRDDYKKPDTIAHAVLADRMKTRDEGSAPQVGDRLAFVYVAERHDKKKQGDRIEEIGFARENDMKADVDFYITNQLQNPLAQLFALALEELEGYVPRHNYGKELRELIAEGVDEETATLQILKAKEKELDALMFLGAPYLKKWKVGPLNRYFKTFTGIL